MTKTEGNRGTKVILGNRKHEIKILILGNKGKCRFYSGEQGNRYPAGRASIAARPHKEQPMPEPPPQNCQ